MSQWTSCHAFQRDVPPVHSLARHVMKSRARQWMLIATMFVGCFMVDEQRIEDLGLDYECAVPDQTWDDLWRAINQEEEVDEDNAKIRRRDEACG